MTNYSVSVSMLNIRKINKGFEKTEQAWLTWKGSQDTFGKEMRIPPCRLRFAKLHQNIKSSKF